MTTQLTRSQLLAQADLALLLSDMFNQPDASKLADLQEARGAFPRLLEMAGLAVPQTLAEIFDGICAQVLDGEVGEWAAEHARLFDCGVRVPINEAGYVRRDKGAILGDIGGFYRAFGLELSDHAAVRPDHLTCELEYVAYMLVMLSNAIDDGRTEQAAITGDALRSFLSEHVGEWVPAFCARLAAQTRLPLFRGLAGLLEGLFVGLVIAHGVVLGEAQHDGGVDEDPGTPYECGLAERGEP